MKTPERGGLRTIFADYSRGHVGDMAMYRALIEYDQWVVPVLLMGSLPDRETFPVFYQSGEQGRLPANRFWIFTDAEALAKAQREGIEPGGCVGGVEGAELFASLSPTWEEIYVNPGSPVHETYFIEPHPEHGYTLCAKYAAAIRLEKAADRIAQTGPAPVWDELQCVEELFLVVLDDGRLLTGFEGDGSAMSLLVFSTPDRLQLFLGSIGDRRLVEGSRVMTLDAGRILLAGKELGYRALDLNVGSARGSCRLEITYSDQAGQPAG